MGLLDEARQKRNPDQQIGKSRSGLLAEARQIKQEQPIIDSADPVQSLSAYSGGGRSAKAASLSENTQADPNQGNALDAVFEPIQAIAGGAFNQVASGLAGLGTLINTSDNQAANKAIEQTQAALPDFAPETKAGQKGLQTLGDLMQAGVDLVNVPISGLAGLATLLGGGGIDSAANTVNSIQDKGLGEALGNNTFEATGSPGLATAAQLAPDLGMAVLGGKTVQTSINKGLASLPKRVPKSLIDEAGKFRPDFKKALESQGVTLENILPEDLTFLPANVKANRAADLIIKRKIKAGDTDSFLATKLIDDSGRVIDDDLAKAAIKQDFDPADIQMIKTSTDATKTGIREMTKIRRKIQGNKRLAADIGPSDVIGRSAMDRVNFVRDKVKESAKELDTIVKTKLSKTPINVKPIAERFANDLIDLKVRFADGELDFAGSLISKDNSAKRVIKDALDLFNEPGEATALRAHELKKQLDNMIDYKRSASKLTPSGEKVVKSVRRELNKAIREMDSDYARVNDTLSSSIQALDDFQSAMGTKFDLLDSNAGNKAGLQLRKIISRFAVKEDMRKAVDTLDDLANELGGNFNDDVKTLTLFNKTLEKRFGAVDEGSFPNEIAQGVNTAMKGKQGFKDALTEKAEKIIKTNFLNQNDLEAYRVIDQLTKGKRPPLRSQATRRQTR